VARARVSYCDGATLGASGPVHHGVGVGFGSDSGVGLRIPEVAEHLELALMVEAGLSPMQAITNATSDAAALLKLDDRGVLVPGLQIWWSSRVIQLPTSAIRGRFTRSGIAARRRRDWSRRSHLEFAGYHFKPARRPPILLARANEVGE
jgi:hypothetical protein